MYERLFKLWYYTVSHNQLLLRSLGVGEECNIDIYFGNVLYIEIPTKLDNIEIIRTNEEDVRYIEQRLGKSDNTITVLLCDNKKYYIVSSIVRIMENRRSMFDLPFEVTNFNNTK